MAPQTRSVTLLSCLQARRSFGLGQYVCSSFPNPHLPLIVFHPAPSEKCVAALLASHYLVRSLVIFASHCPPTLPSNFIPAVRVLHLTSPLAVEDTGAVRLVSTLEWAERVARVWRASGSYGADVVYYDEASKDIPSPAPSSLEREFVSTPSDSAESLDKKSWGSIKGFSIFTRRRRSSSSTTPGSLSSGALPPIDPSQRPFDAILNFISHDVAEKHVLKQTILVTSITRPFLAPTLSPYHKLSGAKKSGKRNSTRRNSVYSLPPTPPHQPGDISTPASSSLTAISLLSTPPPPSHMVHMVPPTARAGLVRNLDLFLSSFSQQTVGTEEVDHAKQYILKSSTMRDVVVHPHFDQECTVFDLILFGCLDSVSGKAWVGSGKDILFLPTSGPSSPSSAPSSYRKPVRSPQRPPSDVFPPIDPAPPPRGRTKSSPQLLFLSGHGSPTSPTMERGDTRVLEYSQPASDQDGFDLSNPSPPSDPVRHHHLQSPYLPHSLNTSPGRARRRSKLNMITSPDDPAFSTSGLPTPPDSDEDARQPSPQTTLAFEIPSPLKRKLKWRFWKS